MSAFVVENKTINSVVNTLAQLRDAEHIKRYISEAGYDLSTYEGKKKLAVEMFSANVRSVNARYDENDKAEDMGFKYLATIPTTAMQCYKSLGCWEYQTCEGDIPETSVVYGVMDQVYHKLAHYIVSRSDEYERAKWE